MVSDYTDSRPAVSVVIPCRNEKDYIKSCIRSIFVQEKPIGDFEVIVADGMSDDGTREVLKRLATKNPRLRIIDNPGRITSCGMNAGIRVARGRYIAIMGAHNTYAPDYLCRCVEILEGRDVDNVGGAMICNARSPFQTAIATAHHSRFAIGAARWHDVNYEGPTDTVFGGVYRREVFDRIGLFDEELVRNQDDEFNLRLTRAGGKIWQSPRIKSWYTPRGSLRTLFQQYLQYGYWKVRVIQKHKLPASFRHLVPGCFVFSLIVLPLVSIWWPHALWIWFTLLGVYGLCNLIASALAVKQKAWKLFLLLPLVIATYHFGYGYGFLRGIWDFIILRRGPSRNYGTLTRPTASSTSQEL